jgi:hypothetical protein
MTADTPMAISPWLLDTGPRGIGTLLMSAATAPMATTTEAPSHRRVESRASQLVAVGYGWIAARGGTATVMRGRLHGPE